MPEILLLCVAAGTLAVVLTLLVRRRALARGVLDIPNARSSHLAPTPRGGGLAIVMAACAAWLVLWAWNRLDAGAALALLGGGIAVAGVGHLDDARGLAAGPRLAVHLLAGAWALYCLGGLPPLGFGALVLDAGWAGWPVGVLGIVWVLNLFNFMDGIDGIAASEAVFIAAAALVLGSGAAAPAAMLASASAGFLVWNWPPARIFMGDVGSGFLGYAIAVLALIDARGDPAALFVWLILGGVFFADATTTLVRRLLRRERLQDAHRTHAYQWLSQRWGSHRRVTLSVLGVNAFYLLPCAALARARPASAALIAVATLLPLIVLAVTLGAGRTRRVSQNDDAG